MRYFVKFKLMLNLLNTEKAVRQEKTYTENAGDYIN